MKSPYCDEVSEKVFDVVMYLELFFFNTYLILFHILQKNRIDKKVYTLVEFQTYTAFLLFYYTDPMCLAINRESKCFISEKNCTERYLYDLIHNLD